MEYLIPTINEITRFGLEPNLVIPNKELILERNLIRIYDMYFDIDFEFDNNNYPDFDRSKLTNTRKNIESNFPDFGFYNIVIDLKDFINTNNHGLGDAVDDLDDIIKDLLEVKWRIENNSLADGLWFFEFTFHHHIQQHILDLLNFMKQKNE